MPGIPVIVEGSNGGAFITGSDVAQAATVSPATLPDDSPMLDLGDYPVVPALYQEPIATTSSDTPSLPDDSPMLNLLGGDEVAAPSSN